MWGYQVPCGVAVNGKEDDGRIYVADYNNRRVVRLTRNGRYDGCFVAVGSNSIQLVQPQALDFAVDGRLVVVDRTHVKVFDVGIRQDAPAHRGSSGTAEAPAPDPPADDRVTDDKHAAAKPRSKKAGPKPDVPPRPKFLKDLTFAGRSDRVQAETKTAGSKPSSSSPSATSTTATTSPAPTPVKTTVARQMSTTSVTSQTSTKSYVETEVW